MAKYERFEDLPVWQEAARLYNAGTRSAGGPQLPIDLGISETSWIERGISVSNNIAEGFERASTKELVGYLGIARGSAGEVRSMIAELKIAGAWRN